MKVTIAKWGNSAAVRLPKSVTADLGFSPGVQLELVVKDGGILIRRPAKSSKDLLREMVAEMKLLGPEGEPETVDWGVDRGQEIIQDAYSRGEITLLSSVPGWRLHPLKGGRKGTWSLRLDRNYRLTFRVANRVIGEIDVEDYH
jgi:antitoxin MazE